MILRASAQSRPYIHTYIPVMELIMYKSVISKTKMLVND